jgi:hypothetical protein
MTGATGADLLLASLRPQVPATSLTGCGSKIVPGAGVRPRAHGDAPRCAESAVRGGSRCPISNLRLAPSRVRVRGQHRHLAPTGHRGADRHFNFDARMSRSGPGPLRMSADVRRGPTRAKHDRRQSSGIIRENASCLNRSRDQHRTHILPAWGVSPSVVIAASEPVRG